MSFSVHPGSDNFGEARRTDDRVGPADCSRVTPLRLSLRSVTLLQARLTASWASSARFTGRPQRKPPSEPSVRTTRWHGTNSAAALRAHADAAARTAAGRPDLAAYSV